MAYTLDCTTSKTIELQDYVDYISSSVKLEDMDDVLTSGEMLRALANNKKFLVHKLNDELQSWRSFQPNNTATAQTLNLARGKGFYIRANMWVPPSKASGVQDWERSLYAYERPHDHNFSFMTVGYFGSGYATTIYECDPDQIIGLPGEQVGMRFLERTTLPSGKVMFYRAGKDIHSQEHPEEFSVSINLMLDSPEIMNRNQYYYDLQNHAISDYVPVPGSGRILLCSLAKHIGNEDTMDALENVLSSEQMPRIKVAAYESLAQLSHSEQKTWERAADDKDPIVRATARKTLDTLTTGQ